MTSDGTLIRRRTSIVIVTINILIVAIVVATQDMDRYHIVR